MNIIDSISSTLAGVDTEWFTKVKHINHMIEELNELDVDISWNASTDMELLIELNGQQHFYYPDEIDDALHFVRFIRDNAYSDKSYLKVLTRKNNDNNSKLDDVTLDTKMKNLKKIYANIDHNVSLDSAVKFKLCHNCGKKVNKTAKKCPYCNSTSFSSDISKYEDKLRLKIKGTKVCPKCNEKFYESNFCINCGEKLITPFEYNELIEKQKQKKIESLKNKKYCPFCSEERNYEDTFCCDCGEKLVSGLDYDSIIKKRKKLENDSHYIQKVKDSPRQNKLKKQTGVKRCPVCLQEISKSAAICVYCRTKLKEY